MEERSQRCVQPSQLQSWLLQMVCFSAHRWRCRRPSCWVIRLDRNASCFSGAHVNPAHYQRSQVLCDNLSIQLTDILHKLYTEAMNLLTMELYARNQLIPGPGYIVTDSERWQVIVQHGKVWAGRGVRGKVDDYSKMSLTWWIQTRHERIVSCQWFQHKQSVGTP